MSFWRRLLLLGSTLPLLFLALGFFIGKANKRTLARIGLISDTITMVVESSKLIGPSTIQAFEQESGLHLRLLEAENFEDFRKFSVEADLWLARTCWLERLASTRQTPSLVHEPWAEKNISPDFLVFKHQELHSAPLFWNIGEVLQFEALDNAKSPKLLLYLVGLKSRKTKLAQLGVETMTRKSFVEKWINEIPWATTYMTLDESFLAKHKKAGSIRELPFQRLELVDSQNTKCEQKLKDNTLVNK